MATWLSWLEQTAHTRQVSGSSPLVAISEATAFGRLYLLLKAERLMATWLSWLEQTAHTRQVSGSSPLVAISEATAFGRLFFSLWQIPCVASLGVELFKSVSSSSSEIAVNILREILFLLTAWLAFTCYAPHEASAQSIGFGFGLGIPLMDYYTNDVGREYRVTPEPGYYPTLSTRENANGSLHLYADVLLPFDDLFIIDEVEIRFDMARMRWQNSRVTHVSCKPVDVVNGAFTDAATTYYKLDDVDEACLNKETYDANSDISEDERASLWFFHLSAGARYHIWQNDSWKLFTGLHLGITIATVMDGAIWGGNVGAIFGGAYHLSALIWLELSVHLMFLLTEIPDDTQTRLNHEKQTGGNILTSIVQPDAYVDFQLAIRFDFSNY